MDPSPKPRTATANGRLWGSRAADWANFQEGTVLAAYRAVLDRAGVGPDTAYLDVGCGSGMAARLAADLGARVSGVDAAAPLLEIARERTPSGAFQQADIEQLPLADDRFDVVTGFNAFQYAGNPQVALAEAGRVTRPGGLVAVVVWGDPATMDMASVIKALAPLMPPPPPGQAGPFALSDELALCAFVSGAGLWPETVFDVNTMVEYPDLDTALRGLNASGVAARAIDIAGEEAVTRAHGEALAPFRATDGRYVLSAAFRCLLARVAA